MSRKRTLDQDLQTALAAPPKGYKLERLLVRAITAVQAAEQLQATALAALPHVNPTAVDALAAQHRPIRECYLNTRLRHACRVFRQRAGLPGISRARP